MKPSISDQNPEPSIPSHWSGHALEARRTLSLALPVIIGQMAGYGMNVVDTVMAGQLLGAAPLAAIAVGSMIWAAFLLLFLGILLAVQASVSQIEGSGRLVEAGSVVRQAAWLCIVLTILMWIGVRHSHPLLELLGAEAAVEPLILAYLDALSWGAAGACFGLLLRFFCEGTGYTRMTLWIGILGVMLNIPLNYALMLGKFGMPELGVVGCGYATAAVLSAQVVFMTVFVARARRFVPYAVFQRFEWPSWPAIRDILWVGLPIGVSVSFEGSLFIGASLLMVKLGTVAMAAHQIALNVGSLLFMIPLGLAGAITIRVGNALGRGEPAMARYMGISGLVIGLGFQLVSATIMFLFPVAIVSLYTDAAEVVELAASLLFLAAIFQLSDGLQICANGGLRGLKDTRMPMLYTMIAYWPVGIGTGYWLTFEAEWGPAGMWVGMIAGLTTAAVLLTIRFIRSSSRLVRLSGPAARPAPGSA